jgi:hypothetical protein
MTDDGRLRKPGLTMIVDGIAPGRNLLKDSPKSPAEVLTIY